MTQRRWPFIQPCVAPCWMKVLYLSRYTIEQSFWYTSWPNICTTATARAAPLTNPTAGSGRHKRERESRAFLKLDPSGVQHSYTGGYTLERAHSLPLGFRAYVTPDLPGSQAAHSWTLRASLEEPTCLWKVRVKLMLPKANVTAKFYRRPHHTASTGR